MKTAENLAFWEQWDSKNTDTLPTQTLVTIGLFGLGKSVNSFDVPYMCVRVCVRWREGVAS